MPMLGMPVGVSLHAPWAAQVPYTDAFMLRTFSADAPLEGRSSFAVEMQEMRYAISPSKLISTCDTHEVLLRSPPLFHRLALIMLRQSGQQTSARPRPAW